MNSDLIKKISWWNSSSGDPDYAALLARGTALGHTLPSASFRTKGEAFIVALKAAGIWTKLDRLSVFKTDGDVNFALLDWKTPTTTCTRVASCTFTSNLGFKSNGSTMYVDTGFSAKNEGVNFQLNDCSMFGYVAEAYATPGVIYGATDAASANWISLDPHTGGNAVFYMESSSFGDNIAGTTEASGLWLSQRTGSTTSKLFRNGTLLGNGTRTSADRPTRDIWLLCRNNDGAINSICDSGVSIGIWGAGASLTGLEAALDTAWDTYIS